MKGKWTIEKLEREMDRLKRFHRDTIQRTVRTSNTEECIVTYRLWTTTRRYNIRAIERTGDKGYLGCTVSRRAPRPGEDWTGCTDLADGKLSAKTWTRILADIVAYEVLPVVECPTESPEARPNTEAAE